jgi:hypothetical protein
MATPEQQIVDPVSQHSLHFLRSHEEMEASSNWRFLRPFVFGSAVTGFCLSTADVSEPLVDLREVMREVSVLRKPPNRLKQGHRSHHPPIFRQFQFVGIFAVNMLVVISLSLSVLYSWGTISSFPMWQTQWRQETFQEK